MASEKINEGLDMFGNRRLLQLRRSSAAVATSRATARRDQAG
jgi:hypothetical protein